MATGIKNNELELLKEIIENLRKFIEQNYFTEDPTFSEVTPIIPGRYQEEFRNAWFELQSVFNNLTNTLEKGDFKRDEIGLSGAQLQLKYNYCKDALNRAEDWVTREKMKERPKNLGWYNKWFSYIKKFLQSSNIVVGSLSKSIPFAEPIKEFVEGIIFLSELGVGFTEENI